MNLFQRISKRNKDISARLKKDHRGSSFVLVMVSLALVMITVAVVCVMIFMQYRMLSMNRQSKDNFYYLEEVLEEMRAGVGNESLTQLKKAYDSTVAAVVYYDTDNQKYMSVSSEEAMNMLNSKFLSSIADVYCTKGTSEFKDKAISDAQLKSLLLSYIQNVDVNTYTTSSDVKVSFGTDFACSAIITKNPITRVGYNISDVTVSRKDAKGNDQSITTDITIYPPQGTMNFTASSEDIDNIFTYAWAADYGVEISGGATTDVRVVGNIYAASDFRNNGIYGGTIIDASGSDKATITGSVAKGNQTTNSSIYSGLFVTGLDTKLNLQSDIVSINGSITADNGAVIRANTKSENGAYSAQSIVWANNIATTGDSTTSSSGKIQGSDIFMKAEFNISDDLEINGEGSDVELDGQYYGYNYGAEEEYTTTGDSSITSQITTSNGKTHTNSSAIIINGENSSLNLSNLSVLMVNGRSYVDLLSENPSDDEGDVTSDIKMSDSIAQKANQLVYRVVEAQDINTELPSLVSTGTKTVGSNSSALTTAVPYFNMIKFLTYQFVKQDQGYRIYNAGNSGTNPLYNSDWAGIDSNSYEDVWKDIKENGTDSKYYQGIIDVYFPTSERIVRDGTYFKKVTNSTVEVEDCYGNEYHIWNNTGSIATSNSATLNRYGFITVGDRYQYVSLVKTVTGANKDEYFYYEFYDESSKKQFALDYAAYTADNEAIDDVTSTDFFESSQIVLPDEELYSVYTRGLSTILEAGAENYEIKDSINTNESEFDEASIKSEFYDKKVGIAKAYKCYFPKSTASISDEQKQIAAEIIKSGTRSEISEAKFSYNTKELDVSPLTNPASININWSEVRNKEVVNDGRGAELAGYTGARVWVSDGDIEINGNDFTNNKTSGIILVRGDVTIRNLKEFTGTIICAGKLYITGETKFYADEQMCNSMIQNDTTNMIRTCFGFKEFEIANDTTSDAKTVSSITYDDLVGFENWIKNGE